MPSRYIQRVINLEPRDCQLILRLAEAKGFSSLDFSAAVRSILREWETLTGFTSKPDADETPDDNRPTVQHSDPNAPNFQHPPFP